MKVVLFQPQIPQNTGNIVRTCSATGTELALVHPLGFSTKSRHLKRAGLDYWDGVQVEEVEDFFSFLKGNPCFFFSSKAKKLYTEAVFPKDAYLVFGSETTGLPDEIWQEWQEHFYTIPMQEEKRCLNLATSAGIVLYEALRQNHFDGLKKRDKTKESTRLIKKEVARGT